MKKALVFITVFCMLIIMLGDTVAAYAAFKPPLSMQIFGKTVTPAPILYKDKVFVPLRALGQALGYQVNYGEKSKTMDLISKTHKVTVTVGYIYAKVNGANVKMDIAPVLSNNSLYVPLTFVQKNFKYSVTHSADKNMVIIDKPGTSSPTTGTAPATQPATQSGTQKPVTGTNSIFVMNKKINSTEKALVKSGIVYIPVRLVGEGLGYKVTWSSAINTMTLAKGSETIVLVSGKTNATVNKKAVKLDVAPYLSGGRLYAPLTMVSKNMGLETTYDNKQNNVSINEKPVTPAKPPVIQVPENIPGVSNIVNIAYDDGGGIPQINISADSAIGSYHAFTMSNPDRLVIDINSAAARTEFSSKEIQQAGLLRVRIGQINNNPAIVRVVVDLASQKSYKVVQSEDKKTLSILYANVIAPVSYQKQEDIDVIVVKGASNLDTSFLKLDNPDRVVLDVKGAVFNDLLQNIPATSSILKSVRIGQFDVGTARVVMDVAPETYFQVETIGNTSKIYLSSYPFEFAQYNRNYNTAVLNLSPGKEVQYDMTVNPENNTVNVKIPLDLKLENKRMDVNDNLVKYVDYKTEVINGEKVTLATISMQDSVESEVISGSAAKLIKIRFKRKITNLQQLTIVIDAGHGGKDPGAVASDGTREKDLNLDVAKRLEKYLRPMGFNIIMTRNDDTYVELGGRTDLANKNYADFFMSIHFNAFSKTSNGIETLYYPNEINEDYSISNRRIAEVFHNEVLKATQRGSRGISARPNLVVLNKTKMPAILAELGFLTNPEELALIKTDKYREDSARALAVSILKYFRDIQGVNVEIDPNSIYSWPYEEQLAQPVTQQETQQTLTEVIEQEVQVPEEPFVEEAAVQPEN
ncbi:MAG TPA: N-acetylmuramoyl-L-alanine amidase family protein [Patescibacteria group bacterium]|nr:N-acetylmuramoyl-L-alanine amidase family protein [Patescibacteria group bacterium]